MPFTYRSEVGRPLTWDELDENFSLTGTAAAEAQAWAITATDAAATAAADAVAASEVLLASYVTDAESASNLAELWSSAPEDVEVEPGLYSALHWAKKAEEAVIGGVIDDTSKVLDKTWSANKLSKGGFENVVVTASQAILSGQYAQITQGASSVTITLPAVLNEGELIMVGNLTSRVDHEINVNGHKLRGQTMSGGVITLDVETRTFTFKYVDSTYGLELLV